MANKIRKFKTYRSMEYTERKDVRRNRTDNRKLQTERVSYEEAAQESFLSFGKKVTR